MKRGKGASRRAGDGQVHAQADKPEDEVSLVILSNTCTVILCLPEDEENKSKVLR